MLERIDVPCPSCRRGRLLSEYTVNKNGSQYFADGEPQRMLSCGHCGARALVTLHGAGTAPTITAARMPPRQHRQTRGHSTHR